MNFKNKINQHKSFIIIVLGAVSIFFTNIILKKILSETDYGEYSLYITFLQMMGSFGLLGFEQVFLRISENSIKGIIRTNKNLLITIFLVWLILSVFSAFIFTKYYTDIEINILFFVISALTVTFSMFIFNVFRLDSEFLTSQIILNAWRILLGLLTIYFIFKNSISISFFIKLFSYFLVLIFIIQLFYFLKKIKFDFSIHENSKELNTYAFHFFVSLLTISLISFGDKFFVKTNFGVTQLGNYFYLATIFVFPFSLIQSYVGFKELVAFKKHPSIINLNKKIALINIFGIFYGLLIITVAYFINKFQIISYINIVDNLALIIIFIFTGVLKLNYSLFSALLGATGNIKSIRNANIQSIFSLGILFIIFYRFLDKIEIVALFLALFWLFRTLIWNYNIKKQFKNR